ncbi:hypothetical protein BS101_11140 [Clostridium kluyveri]|uniref:Uncharacterized protein n=1 Tax=Clostridium kluyveri TaxID=1534 RepID=A0A1L5F8B1_CLOKL|nr:hypothetical protein BS101_11140 [Clostridium kluyveri]
MIPSYHSVKVIFHNDDITNNYFIRGIITLITFKNGVINFSNIISNNHVRNKTSSLKPIEDLSAKLNNNLLHDIGYISDDAKLQYEYMQKLTGAENNTENKSTAQATENIHNSGNTFISENSVDADFIEKYALNYSTIRKEIMEQFSPEESDEKIAILDKAYNDAINTAAQSVTNDFQYFFDYASTKWSYGNTSNDNKFDAEAFKDNLLSLADKAISIVRQAFQNKDSDILNNLEYNIKIKLSGNESVTNIENINYNDIKEIHNFLKELPKFKDHVREYSSDGTYNPVPGNWSTEDTANAINKAYTMTENLLKSGKISDFAGKKVFNTLLKNISAYHKSFAFSSQSDEYQNQINKDKAYYELLKKQYEKYEKKLEEVQKQKKMKLMLIYLEIMSPIKDQLTEAKNRLDESMAKKEALEQNPESVVNTGAYKDISSREIFNEEANIT